MANAGPSVEGPEFAGRVREAEDLTERLKANNWNFNEVPELFARQATCDVAAKEITLIHDGKTQTRIGRLVMVGVGEHFNLMGPEASTGVLKSEDGRLLDEVNRAIGSAGLEDFEEFRALGRRQAVEFYNFEHFYQLRDIVFWSRLRRCGLFPSGFEHFARHIAGGQVIHNAMFSPAVPARSVEEPVVMQAACLRVQFPTSVIEWMDKPLFGGLVKETIHIQNLLTLEPTDVSHPYLPLVGDGRIMLDGHLYYLRRFAGTSPKDGLRGPGVPPEEPQA